MAKSLKVLGDESLPFEEAYYKDSNVGNYQDYMEKKHDGLAKDLSTYFNFDRKGYKRKKIEAEPNLKF